MASLKLDAFARQLDFATVGKLTGDAHRLAFAQLRRHRCAMRRSPGKSPVAAPGHRSRRGSTVASARHYSRSASAGISASTSATCRR